MRIIPSPTEVLTRIHLFTKLLASRPTCLVVRITPSIVQRCPSVAPALLQRCAREMGHFDFRPMRVHQAVTQLLRTERLQNRPAWYDVVGTVTPSTILVRTQPVQHSRRSKKAKRKPSKLFQPLPIVYPEDRLRKTFFQDHPWELARPRMVLESDGKDYQRTDWSRIRQSCRPLDGER